MQFDIFVKHLFKNQFHGILPNFQTIMETTLTYSFNFSLQSFSLNLLTDLEADKVTGLLLSHSCFTDSFNYGISDFSKDSLEGIIQISETNFRELWRYILILVRKYLGKDYLHR